MTWVLFLLMAQQPDTILEPIILSVPDDVYEATFS